ncbi:hypothetical protein, conserved in T. vivax [Trypanosoma vivax Y486]|uniref:Uncharacterized protein n=1 Tax=Trypanosoma vivax (strain Y486) TaxID=1055687 RepID=F9WMG6_TRYVY|nr:hypothetical protein, conserved in T. vivax [Trypanosoma vivax Y486]|eukprot:CCD18723.1 hypothetical protein, conserved in T. vivax [Trypanosoma vivax Y486]
MCGTELARASGSVMQFVRIAGSLVAFQATNAASCLNRGAASLSTNPDTGSKTIDSIIAGVCQGAGTGQVTIEDTQALQKAMETQQSKRHWDISSTSSQYGQKLTDTAPDVACPLFTRFDSSVSSGKASTWIGQSASTSNTKKTTRGTFYTLHATTSAGGDNDGKITFDAASVTAAEQLKDTGKKPSEAEAHAEKLTLAQLAARLAKAEESAKEACKARQPLCDAAALRDLLGRVKRERDALEKSKTALNAGRNSRQPEQDHEPAQDDRAQREAREGSTGKDTQAAKGSTAREHERTAKQASTAARVAPWKRLAANTLTLAHLALATTSSQAQK